MFVRSLAIGTALAVAARGAPVAGQSRTSAISSSALYTTVTAAQDSGRADLDSLVARALVVSPALHVAGARFAAARARVAPAGARPDPMLMAGVQNFPLGQPAFSDFMTMKMIGVSQTIPYPGKLGLQSAAAARESDAVGASRTATRLDVVRQVRDAYYDIAYAERALAITVRNESALADLIQVTQARYSVGSGAQADLLRARLEATRLAQDAVSLAEERRSALARLNALLDQPSEKPLAAAGFPARVLQLVASGSQSGVHFESASPGSRVTGSPLLPLDSLQALAADSNPSLRSHGAMLAAQRERVALARRAGRPDVNVSLQYGQRSGFPDMVTAVVSAPLPLQHAQKQDQEVAIASAELDALKGEHHEQLNALHAEIAARYSDAERARAQLALTTSAILPQARATLASTTASFQVGRIGFDAVIDAQAISFNAEIAYYRSLADFGKALAELEQITGTEVVR